MFKKIFISTFITLSSIISTSAIAAEGNALPSGATAALDSIKADSLAMIDYAWPILAAIVGAFVVVKIFKRVTSKV
ncbi:major coat protein [Enterobacteriaceae bacterium TYF_5]